jgi:hypothetical protein
LPKVVEPHELPSVVRVHAMVSVLLALLQAPVPEQVRSVRVRDCVPLVAHAEPPSHADQAPKVVLPHDTPASTKESPRQAALVPLQRSATSHDEAEARHTRDGPSNAQVPSVTAPCATLHASHAPPHAVSQHTPSTQLLETHSPGAPQATPLGFFAAQYVPLQ